jgi:glycosyltransferase involved in cell wall biosynthesis
VTITREIDRNDPAKLPLVSFVVLNHNYGRYLRECVDSIMSQNYPNIECVIVDNASTDDSHEVIDALARQFPLLKIVRNDENIGQAAAWCIGFAMTSGSYVAFVDADDYLLPNFCGTHIRAHLTLPCAVGFTSAGMLQLANDTIVLGAYRAYSGRKGSVPIKPESLRNIEHMRQGLGTGELESGEFAAELKMVRSENIQWVWSPTSSAVYRRDAIFLFANNPKLKHLRFAADAYFYYGINSITGSVLIEKPLAVYRIHSANVFSRRAALDGMRGFDREMEESGKAALFALEHMVTEFDSFFRYQNVASLWSAMHTLRVKADIGKWQWAELILSRLIRLYFGMIVRNAAPRLRSKRTTGSNP